MLRNGLLRYILYTCTWLAWTTRRKCFLKYKKKLTPHSKGKNSSKRCTVGSANVPVWAYIYIYIYIYIREPESYIYIYVCIIFIYMYIYIYTHICYIEIDGIPRFLDESSENIFWKKRSKKPHFFLNDSGSLWVAGTFSGVGFFPGFRVGLITASY